MFGTRLTVAHLGGKRWELLDPLVWEDEDRLVVIRRGFQTDFASIPKPLRWLLDNAGANSEAAVLHDALWRESKRDVAPGIDPWDADASFRIALRETGSTMLVRLLMWFGVRAAAMLGGRFGKEGPRPLLLKIGQLLGVFVLGVLTALAPTLVALAGLAVFWVANWVVALVARPFAGARDNWPWPLGTGGRPATPSRGETRTGAPPEELLNIVSADSETADAVRGAIDGLWVADEKIAAILREHASPRLDAS